MQTDNPSSGSSSSSNLESPQNGAKSKSKDTIYKKFFKASTGGNKLMRQGHSPCTPPTERHNIEEKENDTSHTASNVYNSTFGTNAASGAGNHASSAASSATVSSFPSFVPGRQTYPKVQNVDKAEMPKVQ